MEVIRWIALAALVAFSGYTIYCSATESIWRSAKQVFALRWGRQVVIDLYLGLLMFSFIVYLNAGSVLVMLAWFAPTLILGNIVPLIYLVLHFDGLVRHFA